MGKLTIKDIDIKNKRVLVRVDFNVPLDEKLNVTDDTRIRAALPTIKYALDKGAKVILMSHLGRPDGKVVEKYSLAPAAKRLSRLIGKDVPLIGNCVGKDAKDGVSKLKGGEVALLENLRFHSEEEKNDENFSKELASLGDVYINDAFGTAHRAHASTAGVAKFLPAASGFLLEKEIKFLGDALGNPAKPFVAILGGAKVSDKILIVERLLEKASKIIIGGGMAYTFLKAKGVNIGSSKLEADKVSFAGETLSKAASKGVKIILPIDHLVVDKVEPNAKSSIAGEAIPDGKVAVDIGPQTIELFKKELADCKTILWNGPLGIFEMDAFEKGTKAICEFVAGLTKKGAVSIIGGGDTAAAVNKFKLDEAMTHISTGGGASLEFLEGKTLPGIAALKDA